VYTIVEPIGKIKTLELAFANKKIKNIEST
jgi:hypothetical protein